jgi:CHAT domain-containing protein
MTPLPTLDEIARALTGPGEALVYLTTGFQLSLGLQPFTGGRIVDGAEPGMALIVTRQMDETPDVQALSLPEMTTNAIDMLLQPVYHEQPSANAEPEAEAAEHQEAEAAPALNIHLEKAIQTLGSLGLNELAATLYARGVRRVLLVPYGRLGLFPLSSVRIQIPHRSACYLGELFEFTFVPSARAAEIARERVKAYAKKRPALLIGGNPQPLTKDRNLGDLPFATAEADTIYRLARGAGYSSMRLHHLVPGEMKKDTVVTRLQEVTYAHLALHGIYHINTPRSSVLILAGTQNLPEEKRTISLGEVLDGKINLQNLRLLVLSACETSLFDIQRLPNEVTGLATGFLQAGVAGVIASLWKVNDEATYLLMTRFARLYLDPQGLWSPAQALAQAQRWLREEATNAVLKEYDPLLPKTIAEAGQTLSDEKYSHQTALKRIRQEATRRALSRPDELPYAHPAYWAGFIATGC